MFPGTTTYPDSMLPEKSLHLQGTWYAWNAAGALLVLEEACQESLDMHGELRVLLANGSAVKVEPRNAIHVVMERLAQECTVHVLQTRLSNIEFEEWNPEVAVTVDAIIISRRGDKRPACEVTLP